MPTPPPLHSMPLHSVPIDIEALPEDLRGVFKGLALYSNGSISVAYRRPMVLTKTRRGDHLWSDAEMHVRENERVVFEFSLEEDL